jgi:periplasmic copper chaperone A
MNRKTILAVTAAAALALPATASAHVTLQPSEVPAGGFTVLNVRVPNERDDSGTRKVAVQMPDGFAAASYEKVPGWTVKVTRGKAPKPIEMHGEQVTEQVDTVTFTSRDKSGDIGPGQFQDFPLSVAMPAGKAGTKLTFKAVQTYRSGEVVRWIGAPDADEPAPQVTLTAAEEDHHAAGKAEHEETAAPASATTGSDDGDGGGSDTLAIVALAVGGLGLAAGVGAFAASRRGRGGHPSAA